MYEPNATLTKWYGRYSFVGAAWSRAITATIYPSFSWLYVEWSGLKQVTHSLVLLLHFADLVFYYYTFICVAIAILGWLVASRVRRMVWMVSYGLTCNAHING